MSTNSGEAQQPPGEPRQSRLPHPIRTLGRRITSRVARPYFDELKARLDELKARLDDRFELLATEMRNELGWTRAILRHIADEEAANRRRLYALRADPEYEMAFSEQEPLVTFVIATYSRYETLRDVALPSILNQTYSNLEVIVVGDGSPPETREAIADLDDPRVHYQHRNRRGPYPENPERRWFVVGTPPYNEGVSLARGRWIAPMDDDDAIRPDHTESLVAAAQEHRYEVCYGHTLVRFPEAESASIEMGEFPPRPGEFSMQASISHSGLSFFELEPLDALYEEHGDWSLWRRMLAAGVRFGMIDAIVLDKHETRHTVAEWNSDAPAIPELE